MSFKYGWSCKTCGWTHLSDDKVEVADFKRNHKKLGCLMLDKGNGVLCRATLGMDTSGCVTDAKGN
jgi:hypothetical protein